MVAGDVVPHDAVGVEVVEHPDAELGLAAVPQLVAIVRLRLLVPAACGAKVGVTGSYEYI